jgi:hypothetical protein
MESLNGHEAGNGGHGQGNTYGNSPFLDPTHEFMGQFLKKEPLLRLRMAIWGPRLPKPGILK